jgi:hypothetical protein
LRIVVDDIMSRETVMDNNEEGNGNGAAGVSASENKKEETLAVKVALNVRPLIGLERVQGCKDCITVVPGEPQVSHSEQWVLEFQKKCWLRI